ncbi:MAG: Ig-like domain-containing protein, partial [Candidatus Zixiibacteriota bacterium]
IHASDIDGDPIILDTLNVPVNAVFVDSGNGAGSFVFTPDFTQSGVFYVTFVASDGFAADSEVVEITVTEYGNHVPVLDSIGPQAVVEGDMLEFRIHASDIDGDPIILDTLNVPVNAVFVDSGNGAGSFLFIPDFDQSGVFYVTFIASDGSAADSEVVEITVTEFGNHTPELDSIGPQTVVEGNTLEFRIHASDTDSDPLILDTLNVPANAVFVDSGNGAGSFVFTPNFAQSGTFYVTFMASDGSAADSEVVEITVTEFGNHVPELDSIGPQTVVEGDTLEFRVHATDLDLDSIILQTVDRPIHATFVDSGNESGSFFFAPDFSQSGDYYVTFVASDGPSADSQLVQITVTEYGNHAPELDSIGTQTLVEGDTLELRIHAIDVDGDPIVLDTVNVPPNAVFVDSGNGAGSFIFTPDFTQAGRYDVTFFAFDGFLADSEDVQIVVIESGNHAPELDSIGSQLMTEGDTLEFRIHAIDPDTDPIMLDTLNVPLNAVFVDSGNGAGSFTFMPDYSQSGIHNVTFIASDPLGAADSQTVVITVMEFGNHAPELDSIGPQTVSELDILEFRIHAVDIDADSLILDTLNIPLNAVFVDSGNGAGSFTFAPDTGQTGIYYVTFMAADTALADSEVVEITVTEWSNRPPVLDSIGPKTVSEGGTLSFGVAAHDPDGTIPLLATNNLPGNATFVDSGNGHGYFEFHPDFYQAGVDTVAFQAIDTSMTPELSDIENVVITVLEVNQPPVIDSIGPKTVRAGSTLTIRVVGRDLTDPDGGPLHLSILGLPPNATFVDSGGGIGGFVFAPDYSQVGVDTVTFRCLDEGSPPMTGSQKVEITVTEGPNRPPVLAYIGYKMVTEGDTLEFRVHAADPDGTTPQLYTSMPLPTNASFTDSGNGAGSFLFTPDFTQSALHEITFYASDGDLIDNERVFVQVVEAGNQYPVLDSIGSQSVLEGDTLIIIVRGIDPDSTIPELSVDSLPFGVSFADSGDGTGVFEFHPVYVQAGVYSITFMASDGELADSEAVQITVIEAGNQAPAFVDSIGPRSVKEREWLTFGVGAADPDSTTPILRASDLPPSADFTDNGDGTGTFVYRPTYEEQGVYYTLFEAVDSVDTLLKGWELVEITVIDSNRHPTVFVQPDVPIITVDEGDTTTLTVIGTDPDGTIPSLHVVPMPDNATFTDSGNGVGVFVFTPDHSQGGVYPQTFRVYVESVFVIDETYPDTIWAEPQPIWVYDVPEPPGFVPMNDTSVVEGDTLDIYVVTTSIADIPALAVIGSPANSSFEDSGNGRGWFHFEPDFTQGGSGYLVGFVATSRGLVDTEYVQITVLEWGNNAPVLDFIGAQTVGEEQVLSFRIHATDIDGDAITLDTLNVPQNAVFVDSGNGAGSFVFNPDWTQAGVYYVTFYAEDTPGAIDSEVVEITVTNVDQPPVLNSIGAKTVAEGETLQFRVHATDLDSDSLVLTAGPLPGHATFVDSGNGAGSFTFTPDYYQAEVYSVYFSVSDLVSSDMEMVPITVTNVPQPPDLDLIPLQSLLEGDTLEFRIHATDPDGDPFVLSVENNPANSSLIDSGNGAGSFLFTPSYLQSGTYQFPIYATDTTGRADSAIVQVEVIEAGNQPPVLASLPDSVEPAVGRTFIRHVYATDPDGPSISLSTMGAPWNSDFADSGNGGGVFTFAPDSTQEDSIYLVTFIASDGSLADSQTVVMQVISYVPGDVNGDGSVNVGDVVALVDYLYRGGPPPDPMAAGDTNCDGHVNVGDVVYLVDYLYRGGPPPTVCP